MNFSLNIIIPINFFYTYVLDYQITNFLKNNLKNKMAYQTELYQLMTDAHQLFA
jgi:hypothetical protein